MVCGGVCGNSGLRKGEANAFAKDSALAISHGRYPHSRKQRGGVPHTRSCACFSCATAAESRWKRQS
jgi:hypothetical protein